MHLLPSDIARLVLGYLKEKCLKKTFVAFLQESPDLSEYWSMLNTGQMPTTTVMGLSLQSVLEEYTALTLRVKALSAQTSQDNVETAPGLEQRDIDAVLENHRKAELERKHRTMRQKTRRKSPVPGGSNSSERNQPSPSHVVIRHQSETVEASSSPGCSTTLKQENNIFSNNKSSEVDDLDDEFEFDSLDQLLADTKLHEKLAESINKALRRDQGVATDQLNTPSDTAKKKRSTSLSEGGGRAQTEGATQKSASSVVAIESIEDIISMTALEPGLEQLLSLFQFQSEVAPHNHNASESTSSNNHQMSSSSIGEVTNTASLYLPTISSNAVQLHSSHDTHQMSISGQASSHSPQTEKNYQTSNLQPPQTEKNYQTSNLQPPQTEKNYQTSSLQPPQTEKNYQTSSLQPPQTEKNYQTSSLQSAQKENNYQTSSLQPPQTEKNYQTSNLQPPQKENNCETGDPNPSSTQHIHDSNIVHGIEAQEKHKTDACKMGSSLPLNKKSDPFSSDLSPQKMKMPSQPGVTISTQSCKKSRTKRMPKKLMQNNNSTNTRPIQGVELQGDKETLRRNSEMVNKSCANLSKHDSLTASDKKATEGVSERGLCSNNSTAESQSQQDECGVAGENQEKKVENNEGNHTSQAVNTLRDVNAKNEGENNSVIMETENSNAPKTASHNLSEPFGNVTSPQLSSFSDFHQELSSSSSSSLPISPLLKTTSRPVESHPLVHSEKKDASFVSQSTLAEPSFPLPPNQAALKPRTVPEFGMEDNSLSVFSFIEKSAAEMTGETYIPRHLRNQGSFEANTEVKGNEKSASTEGQLSEQQTLCGEKGHRELKREKCIPDDLNSLYESVESENSLTNKKSNQEEMLRPGEVSPKVKNPPPHSASVVQESAPLGDASTDNVKSNHDGDSFDYQLSTPDAVYVRPLGFCGSTLERNIHVVDTCLQNILGDLKVEIQSNSDNADEQQRETSVENSDDAADSDKIGDEFNPNDELAETEQVNDSMNTPEKEKDVLSEQTSSEHVTHDCDGIDAVKCYSAATISTPFVFKNNTVSDNSPRKLVENQIRNNECVSMPASLPSVLKEKSINQFLPKSGNSQPGFPQSPSKFRQSPSKFRKRLKKNFSSITSISEASRKVIACNMAHSPFIPSHCKKSAPSRRITPMEVSFSTPSPLQVMSPASPADFIIDLAHSPSLPCTPAKDSTSSYASYIANDADKEDAAYTRNKLHSRGGTKTCDPCSPLGHLSVPLDKPSNATVKRAESEDHPIHVQKVDNNSVSSKPVKKDLTGGQNGCEKSIELVVGGNKMDVTLNNGEPGECLQVLEKRQFQSLDAMESSGRVISQRPILSKQDEVVPKVDKNDMIPSPVAHREVDSEQSNLSSSNITLPSSPSQRKARRVVPTLISRTISEVGSDQMFSTSSCSQNGSMFSRDESKIVSSSSDLACPHSEAEAFRILKNVIFPSYTKPQPTQEITSSNMAGGRHPSSAMEKCGCLSREVCTHVKGKCRKALKKHGTSFLKSKDIEMSLKKSNMDNAGSESGVSNDVRVGIICDSSSKDDVNGHNKDIDCRNVEKHKDSSLSSSEAFIAVATLELSGKENLESKQPCPGQQDKNEDGEKDISSIDCGGKMKSVESDGQDSCEKCVPSADLLQVESGQEAVTQTDQHKSITTTNDVTKIGNVKFNSNTGSSNNDSGQTEESHGGHNTLLNPTSIEFEEHDGNVSLAAPYFPELSNTFDFFKLRNRRLSTSDATDSKHETKMPTSHDINELGLHSGSPVPTIPTSQLSFPPRNDISCLLSQAMKQCGIPLELSELSLMENSTCAELNVKATDTLISGPSAQTDLLSTTVFREPEGAHMVATHQSGHVQQASMTQTASAQNSSKSSRSTRSKKTNRGSTQAVLPKPILPSSGTPNSLQPLLNPSAYPGQVAYFRQPNQPPIPFVILSDGKIVCLPNGTNVPPPPPPPPIQNPFLTLPAPDQNPFLILPPAPPPPPPAAFVPPLPPPASSRSVTPSHSIQRSSKARKKKIISKSKTKDSKRCSPKEKKAVITESLQKVAQRRKIEDICLSPKKASVSTYFKKSRSSMAKRKLALSSTKISPAVKNGAKICDEKNKKHCVKSTTHDAKSDRDDINAESLSELNSVVKETQNIEYNEAAVTVNNSPTFPGLKLQRGSCGRVETGEKETTEAEGVKKVANKEVVKEITSARHFDHGDAAVRVENSVEGQSHVRKLLQFSPIKRAENSFSKAKEASHRKEVKISAGKSPEMVSPSKRNDNAGNKSLDNEKGSPEKEDLSESSQKEKVLSSLSLRKKESSNKPSSKENGNVDMATKKSSISQEEGKRVNKKESPLVVTENTDICKKKSPRKTANSSSHGKPNHPITASENCVDKPLELEDEFNDVTVKKEKIENIADGDSVNFINPFSPRKQPSGKDHSKPNRKSFTDIVKGVYSINTHTENNPTSPKRKARPRSSEPLHDEDFELKRNKSPAKSRRRRSRSGKRNISSNSSSLSDDTVDSNVSFANMVRDKNVSLVVIDGGEVIRDVSDSFVSLIELVNGSARDDVINVSSMERSKSLADTENHQDRGSNWRRRSRPKEKKGIERLKSIPNEEETEVPDPTLALSVSDESGERLKIKSTEVKKNRQTDTTLSVEGNEMDNVSSKESPKSLVDTEKQQDKGGNSKHRSKSKEKKDVKKRESILKDKDIDLSDPKCDVSGPDVSGERPKIKSNGDKKKRKTDTILNIEGNKMDSVCSNDSPKSLVVTENYQDRGGNSKHRSRSKEKKLIKKRESISNDTGTALSGTKFAVSLSDEVDESLKSTEVKKKRKTDTILSVEGNKVDDVSSKESKKSLVDDNLKRRSKSKEKNVEKEESISNDEGSELPDSKSKCAESDEVGERLKSSEVKKKRKADTNISEEGNKKRKKEQILTAPSMESAHAHKKQEGNKKKKDVKVIEKNVNRERNLFDVIIAASLQTAQVSGKAVPNINIDEVNDERQEEENSEQYVKENGLDLLSSVALDKRITDSETNKPLCSNAGLFLKSSRNVKRKSTAVMSSSTAPPLITPSAHSSHNREQLVASQPSHNIIPSSQDMEDSPARSSYRPEQLESSQRRHDVIPSSQDMDDSPARSSYRPEQLESSQRRRDVIPSSQDMDDSPARSSYRPEQLESSQRRRDVIPSSQDMDDSPARYSHRPEQLESSQRRHDVIPSSQDMDDSPARYSHRPEQLESSHVIPSSQNADSLTSPFLTPVASTPANSSQGTSISLSQRSTSSAKSITKRKINKLISKLYKTPPQPTP